MTTARPAPLRIGFKTSPQDVGWATVDATWARAGELGAFDSGWLNDHLTSTDPDDPGPSLEALTLLATLVHHVPGTWVGHGVLSNTFRHPAVLAKAATVLDHASGGRFILGLGAGWFEAEHEPFGIPLPPIGERIDRLVSAVEVLRAMWSRAAETPPGVTRPDRFYPLAGATNRPMPVQPNGPPIYLGGQKRRGIELAARAADGWLLPGTDAGNVAYFADRRDALLRAMDAIARDPAGFAFVAQVSLGDTSAAAHAEALDVARKFARAGATEVVLAIQARRGPEALTALAEQVARPLREAAG
jgi:alkanesulfonate monooxygenase SsuD/methylene tetrahydromethanopterin reductase-like flavin-dependent oxidoreductase (luciferase family)